MCFWYVLSRGRALKKLIVILMLTVPLAAAPKDMKWEMGTVHDVDIERRYAGSTGHASGEIVEGGSRAVSERANYSVYEVVAVKGETHAYLTKRYLRWRWTKRVNLTVGAPVKFGVKGRNLWLIDEDGREFKLSIVKKLLSERLT